MSDKKIELQLTIAAQDYNRLIEILDSNDFGYWLAASKALESSSDVEKMADEASRRYPEQISVVGKNSDRKQRQNQRIFIEGAKWMQKQQSSAIVWVKAEIKKRMDNYFNKSFEMQQKIDKGNKNSDVFEKCKAEYSSRGLELSWVLELLDESNTSAIVESEEKTFDEFLNNYFQEAKALALSENEPYLTGKPYIIELYKRLKEKGFIVIKGQPL